MWSKWATTFSWVRLTAYLNVISAFFIGFQGYTPCRASGAVSGCGVFVAVAALLCIWMAKRNVGAWRSDLSIFRAVALVLLVINLFASH